MNINQWLSQEKWQDFIVAELRLLSLEHSGTLFLIGRDTVLWLVEIMMLLRQLSYASKN